MTVRFATTVQGGAQMVRAQQTSAQVVSRVLVFHETGAAGGTPKFLEDLRRSFPRPREFLEAGVDRKRHPRRSSGHRRRRQTSRAEGPCRGLRRVGSTWPKTEQS